MALFVYQFYEVWSGRCEAGGICPVAHYIGQYQEVDSLIRPITADTGAIC